MIGLVAAYLDNQFYPQVLERLSNALQNQGYHVLVFMASQDAGNLDQVTDEILDYQVDGLILASVAMTGDIARRCRATGVPVILFNRRQERRGEIAVVSDNRDGGRQVAEHLISLGRRKIAYLAGAEGASTQRDREVGFSEALEQAGLSVYARAIGGFRPEIAADAVREMFRGPDRPDAVFAANDSMAFAAMDVLRSELGLDVPGDVAMAGFDDTLVAAWPGYDLTSVRQDIDRMVEDTAEIMIARIEGRKAEVTGLVPVTLSVRGSTVGRG